MVNAKRMRGSDTDHSVRSGGKAFQMVYKVFIIAVKQIITLW